MAPGDWDGSHSGAYGGGEPPNSPNQQIQKLMAVLNWSLPAGVYFAVRVRLHILLLAFAAYWLITTDDLFWALRTLLVLFVSVLLHEFGHVMACRRVGGTAHDILMWPLGGLAYCAPPHSPWAHFVTVICGPMVNLVLAAGAYLSLLVWQGHAIPVGLNPFSPWIAWTESTSVELVAQVFVVNYILLLFNTAMLFYPLDGGRILQAILWWRLGYGRGSFITFRIGIAGACLALLVGLLSENKMLSVIAIFGLIESVQLGMRLKSEAFAGQSYSPVGYGRHEQPVSDQPGIMTRWSERRRKRVVEARQQREQALNTEVDRILDKVRDQGLASLSSKEKKILGKATEKKKGAG